MNTVFDKIRFWPESNQDTAGQLADQLRQAILAEKLGPGQKLPSSAVLAKKLSLGVQTIQIAFKYLVAEGLIVRRPRHGTFVTTRNEIQGLKTARNYQIGWIIFNLASDSPNQPSLSVYLESMQKILEKHNCNLHVFTVDPADVNSRNNIIFRSASANKQIDAAVVRSAMPGDFLKILRDADIPFVRQDFIADGPEPSVSDDPIALTELAIQHLLMQGHQKVAMVTSKISYEIRGPNFDGTYHWLGYCRALARHNIALDPDLVKEVPGWPATKADDCAQAMVDLAKRANRPSAMYVAHEEGAIKGIKRLKAEGFRVPEDVSIIARGSGNKLDLLTTVQDDLEKVGQLCAEVILKTLVEGRYPDKKRYFVPSFIIPRKSVSCHRRG